MSKIYKMNYYYYYYAFAVYSVPVDHYTTVRASVIENESTPADRSESRIQLRRGINAQV